MKKQVAIKDFVEELLKRIDDKKTIDCCKDEIRNFAMLVKQRMGDETIEVNWKD